MFDRLMDGLLRMGDLLLGWLLWLPTDAALLLAAAGTAAILLLLRRWTTNQDLLRRAADDKRRLRELVRQAKRRKDKPAVLRHRATLSQAALKQLRAEGPPLAAAILPVLLLALWCSWRLGFHPPQAGEPVEVVLHAPVSAVGETAYIVPQDGLDSPAWIREISAPIEGAAFSASAQWVLTARPSAAPYRLHIRAGQRMFEHELLVGQRTYREPLAWHDATGEWASEVRLRPVKLLGVVPGLDAGRIPGLRRLPLSAWLVLPPWITAYLLITIPVTYGLKALLRIS